MTVMSRLRKYVIGVYAAATIAALVSPPHHRLRRCRCHARNASRFPDTYSAWGRWRASMGYWASAAQWLQAGPRASPTGCYD